MLIKSFIWFRLISVMLLLSWAAANQITPSGGLRQADGYERGSLWSPATFCLLRRRKEILPCSVAFSSLFFHFSSFKIFLTGVTANKPACRFWHCSIKWDNYDRDKPMTNGNKTKIRKTYPFTGTFFLLFACEYLLYLSVLVTLLTYNKFSVV